MASTKAALKAAKAAIDAKEWETATTQAQTVLSSDPKNYFAKLFLGRAFDKQGKVAESAKAYEDAAEIRPDDDQAWIGLQALYEGQGSNGIDGYIWASWNLAKVYVGQGNKHKCQTVVDKLVGVGKNRGTKTQYKKALAIQLPSGPVYEFLEGRLPHPSHTYTRLAETTEAEEKAKEKTEVETRRTRIGAKKDQVVAEVKREIYGQSDLEELYQGVIDWTEDDGTRRKYEEKLLQRAYDTLLVLPNDEKAEKREQVLKQAHGMIIIKHAYTLAWDIELEWRDVERIEEMDASTLHNYTNFFPDKGLSKVLKAYLNSSISSFPARPPPQPSKDALSDDDDDDVGGGVSLVPTAQEDILLVMTDGLTEAKNSALAHRLVGEYYNHLEEHETAIDTLRTGLRALASESRKSGLKLQHNTDAMNTMLATALVHYQTPRFHGEARSLFEDILSRKSNFTPALIGVGLILEEDEEYNEAIDYLTKALKRDPNNARVGAELAWCKALNGDLQTGLNELEQYYQMMDEEARDMRAETLYRIGKCQWDLDPSRASRKDRKGSYAQFLAAIKANINLAPAYTMLGIYYSDYGRDRKRARQCFQKAFELSPSEVEAAERLARSFADQGDWDIVEIIAQRVVDSGKTRPPPGSKKKGISWPYSALGVVQMSKQEYQQAIVSFLAALRIAPDDYHSYVGLGESYHNSGRYNSAARTFNYAESPHDGIVLKKSGESWFTQYMLANVNRELGAYDEAIEGYEAVLSTRKQEFGVEIALLQTYLERAWRNIETGFFGGAIDSTTQALEVAVAIVEYVPDAFNLWKAVADACAVFSIVQDKMEAMPRERIRVLLGKSFEEEKYKLFAENDGIELNSLANIDNDNEGVQSSSGDMRYCLTSSILAHKRAIISCAHDHHAQAVSWYNLGWAEYRAHVCLEEPQQSMKRKPSTRYLKASMRCFKRAIELEAGNPEFWNALGVITTKLNPKVAQHAFVRSLHLNERNVKAWTNLGVLYFLQNDFELAHTAFARAQSTDPDYAHAWVGEGLIALMWGNVQEALLHFKHAFEISESGSVVVKKEYAAHTFDHLITQPSAVNDTLHLIQPLFALQQLNALDTGDQPFELLSALYNERIGGHNPAITTLMSLCGKLEAEYEQTESLATMARFAQAKVDLARNHLANGEYEASSEEANLALDLTSEDDTIPAELVAKIRLSARLTLGLASYYLKDMDAALDAFRKALQDSNAEPDVVCMLAEVLWARGGEDERAVAKEQLFDAIQRQPGHVNSVVLLGAMSSVEEDADTLDAVREELEALRVKEGISQHDLSRIERVLEAMAQICPQYTGDAELETLNEIQETVMLYPWKATGWRRLAQESEDAYAKEMALTVAMNNVPPKGPLSADELCEASAQAGTVGDAQRAIFVAPWKSAGWEAMIEGFGGRS